LPKRRYGAGERLKKNVKTILNCSVVLREEVHWIGSPDQSRGEKGTKESKIRSVKKSVRKYLNRGAKKECKGPRFKKGSEGR